MQKAIENYIDIQSKDLKPLEEIECVVDKVARAAIQKEREKRYKQWRKLGK